MEDLFEGIASTNIHTYCNALTQKEPHGALFD
jgi:hypothetical protein